MLDADVEALTGDLRDELDANEPRAYVDPRTIPTRFSLLKRMAQSPAHYREACQEPQDDSLASRLGAFATDRKEALRFGTAVHLMLLGDVDKIGRFAGRRAGKAWESFQLDSAEKGRTVILNEKEYREAFGVATAVRANKIAMRLLFDNATRRETRIDWTFVGRACRSTPDAEGTGYVVDLKTSVTSEPTAFARHALRLFYHAQASLYSDAIEADGRQRPVDAYVIAVEKSRPMPVSIFRFSERALDQGAKLCRAWIERLLACEAADEWPEYLQQIGELDLDDRDEELELEWNGKKVAVPW